MCGKQRRKKMCESGTSIEGRKCEESVEAEVEIVVAEEKEENDREWRKKRKK